MVLGLRENYVRVLLGVACRLTFWFLSMRLKHEGLDCRVLRQGNGFR